MFQNRLWLSIKELNAVQTASSSGVAWNALLWPGYGQRLWHWGQESPHRKGWCAWHIPDAMKSVPSWGWWVGRTGALGALAREVCDVPLINVALSTMANLVASPGGPKGPTWDSSTSQDPASASAGRRCLRFSPRPL